MPSISISIPVMNNKIHPRSSQTSPIRAHFSSSSSSSGEATPLTVWNKSLIFNCKGFTVYDANGNLVFRVDNYDSIPTREIILMDGTGNDLLAMRRKRFSLRREWEGFCQDRSIFRIRKSTSCWFWGNKKKKALAEVFMGPSKHSQYYVEGSFCKRSCTVYNSRGSIVAEVKRKQAAITSSSSCMLQTDVFSLVVQPGYDQSLVMGFIVTLDNLTNRPCFLKQLLNI